MDLRAHPNAPAFASSFSSNLCVHTKPSSGGVGRRRRNLTHIYIVRAGAASMKTEQNQDLPPVVPRNKKKPWVTPPKRGGFLTKLRRGEPTLRRLPTPDNGLLVPNLIPVAHQVVHDRTSVIQLVPKLMQVVPVKVCKFCSETHVGPVGHGIATCNGPYSGKRHSRHVWTTANVDDVIPQLDTYHLYDRLRTVSHTERLNVARLPALVELCIQAGVDSPEYPTLRRTRPVKAIGRKLVEEDVSLFEFEEDDEGFLEADAKEDTVAKTQDEYRETFSVGDEADHDIDSGNHSQENVLKLRDQEQTAAISTLLDAGLDMTSLSSEEVVHVAEMTLEAWTSMRNGAKKLMTKYPVRVCGYCPEVHIGPRGHKVKMCGAFKHQWRAGQHGWQKATLDDLIPPKYVWHVQDLQAPCLENQLRRYYGQTPAVVELCVQAGAAVPNEFKPMMRLDVTIPDISEIYNAV